MRRTVTFLALTLLAAPLAAQNEQPAGWEVRFDRADADASALTFMSMERGWHITTGPAGIFYEPQTTGTGQFAAEATFHLFDPKGRREGFGLFVGGKDLKGDGQSYLYFLIRNDGRYLVKTRNGSETATLKPWTEHAAIKPFDPSQSSIENVLGIAADDATVTFYINGEKATSLPRADANVDGIVGLRVNHALNVHVTDLKVAKK